MDRIRCQRLHEVVGQVVVRLATNADKVQWFVKATLTRPTPSRRDPPRRIVASGALRHIRCSAARVQMSTVHAPVLNQLQHAHRPYSSWRSSLEPCHASKRILRCLHSIAYSRVVSSLANESCVGLMNCAKHFCRGCRRGAVSFLALDWLSIPGRFGTPFLRLPVASGSSPIVSPTSMDDPDSHTIATCGTPGLALCRPSGQEDIGMLDSILMKHDGRRHIFDRLSMIWWLAAVGSQRRQDRPLQTRESTPRSRTNTESSVIDKVLVRALGLHEDY
ncbi:hypothetical protein EK21DRAFT_88975 [Setomelanomma holmii]|uniref:Uncharacterized protein n=1 Tax=Setomelanomma holmii TaxID=210430 RepID=A0A9P4HBB7_9PLEO|nr:hypothetical protein EK21DRAFT_88975 [Setomelanomma holmii]